MNRATTLLTMIRAREVMIVHASRCAVAHAEAGREAAALGWLEVERHSVRAHEALASAYEFEFGEVRRDRHNHILIDGPSSAMQAAE
jgi:hypothetical protein